MVYIEVKWYSTIRQVRSVGGYAPVSVTPSGVSGLHILYDSPNMIRDFTSTQYGRMLTDPMRAAKQVCASTSTARYTLRAVLVFSPGPIALPSSRVLQ